jgi:hypothetical protein
MAASSPLTLATLPDCLFPCATHETLSKLLKEITIDGVKYTVEIDTDEDCEYNVSLKRSGRILSEFTVVEPYAGLVQLDVGRPRPYVIVAATSKDDGIQFHMLYLNNETKIAIDSADNDKILALIEARQKAAQELAQEKAAEERASRAAFDWKHQVLYFCDKCGVQNCIDRPSSSPPICSHCGVTQPLNPR